VLNGRNDAGAARAIEQHVDGSSPFGTQID
jgi:hypothetical protein